jgi:hypothetical protein
MKPVQRLIPWLALVLIVGLIGFLLSESRKRINEARPESGGNRSEQGLQPAQPVGASQNPSPGPRLEAVPVETARLLDRSFERFRNSRDVADSLAILKELRDGIRAADPANAASAIHDFLKSGHDIATRLPFVVASGGVMETTPTFRTALLDLAPALDPALALRISREIMDSKNSPDEFALALRNLAWNDLDGDSTNELSDRFKQMIETNDWSSNPSAGFLEALDAAVEIADGNVFGAMLGLGARANSELGTALSRASLVALDRMVLRDPSLLVNSFVLDPGMSGIAPDQRASLMSRLDLGDPAQRDLFSRYLMDTEQCRIFGTIGARRRCGSGKSDPSSGRQ